MGPHLRPYFIGLSQQKRGQGGVLFKRAHLTMETEHGSVRLHVEVADTGPAREQGLMFRRGLPENGGMIFLFGEEQEIGMWMKNTYIPLDMVFIGGDWRIVHIAPSVPPLSTAFISSVRPCSSVLEIAAGRAKALGLRVGGAASLSGE